MVRRALRAVLALTALAAVCVATPATAAPTAPVASITVTGTGNGHSYGMSQWGAYTAAKQGKTYTEILDFYYSPFTRATIQLPETISVWLASLGDSTSWTMLSPSGFPGLVDAKALRATWSPTGIVWEQSPTAACDGVFTPAVVTTPEVSPDGVWGLCKTTTATSVPVYSGSFVPTVYGATLRPVNIAPLADYVTSVVSGEMSESWATLGAAALQAQAVAARSYALAQGGSLAGKRYSYAKTCDTTSCQWFRGLGTFNTATGAVSWFKVTRSAEAELSTRNEVLMSGSAIANAMFAASNGGWVYWPTSKADPFDPIKAATKVISQQTLASVGIGPIAAVDVVSYSVSAPGYRTPVSIRFTSTSGATKTLTGSQARSLFGLSFAWWEIATPATTASYAATSMTRIADTRQAIGLVPSTGLRREVALPAPVTSSTVAVALTVTITTAKGPGAVYVYAKGTPKPPPTLQYIVGDTKALFVIIATPLDKTIVVDSTSEVAVILDMSGTFSSTQTATAGRTLAITPVRALDSRSMTTYQKVKGTSVNVPLPAAVPVTATAVWVNVTLTRPLTTGFVTVYPAGTTRPATSSANIDRPGQTRASLMLIPVSPSGLTVYAALPTDIIVDVVGYVSGPSTTASSAGLLNIDQSQPATVSYNIKANQPTTILSSLSDLWFGEVSASCQQPGFLTVWAKGLQPSTSSLNMSSSLATNALLLEPTAPSGASAVASCNAAVTFTRTATFTGA